MSMAYAKPSVSKCVAPSDLPASLAVDFLHHSTLYCRISQSIQLGSPSKSLCKYQLIPHSFYLSILHDRAATSVLSIPRPLQVGIIAQSTPATSGLCGELKHISWQTLPRREQRFPSRIKFIQSPPNLSS